MPSGKVTGVVYADADGKMQRQKARVVAVAGNSIESPRLLLNSASSMFPDGLANSSGQVGRNYMRHMTGSVYAVFDKPVHMYRGTTMAGIIRDEAQHDPKRGFVGGYEMETLSLGLPFMAAFLNPGAWGRSFTSAHGRLSATWPACGSSARTCRRRPTASRSIRRRRTPSACRWPACISTTIRTTSRCATTPTGRVPPSMRRSARRRTFPTPPYPSTHNLGTNRMSDKPRDGVVNKYGQTHDIKNLFVSDGSQFTTGAACNPTLTIVSLAIRQADHIAGAMQRKDI